MAPMEIDGRLSPTGLFTQCNFAVVRNGNLDDEAVAQKASWMWPRLANLPTNRFTVGPDIEAARWRRSPSQLQ